MLLAFVAVFWMLLILVLILVGLSVIADQISKRRAGKKL